MFPMDKKKAANVILSRIHKDGHESSGEMKPEHAVDQAFEGLHVASQDMINAIHSKSAMDFHKALSSYLEQHKGHGESGEEASKDDSPDGKASEDERASEGNPQF
jgi:hypothetical protein